ncbi:MAG: hypothetical protein WCP20_17110 [Desulfuromonadales bacterium]
MNVIDWHEIATAIRENRFKDIPTKTWVLVADKIDTVKRGKGRPADKKIGLFGRPLGENNKITAASMWRADRKKGTYGGMEMTMVERTLWIEERFEELRAEGKRSEEAKKQIASELARTTKTVEANLTDIRKVRKIEHDIWVDEMESRNP